MELPDFHVPAAQLVSLRSKVGYPFTGPVWISGIDETRFNPPMLLEGATESRDPLLPGWVDLSVWTKGHRPHLMAGLIVEPETPVFFTFEEPV